jgi:hypothetical protein
MGWSRRTSALYLAAVACSALISTVVTIERSRRAAVTAGAVFATPAPHALANLSGPAASAARR